MYFIEVRQHSSTSALLERFTTMHCVFANYNAMVFELVLRSCCVRCRTAWVKNKNENKITVQYLRTSNSITLAKLKIKSAKDTHSFLKWYEFTGSAIYSRPIKTIKFHGMCAHCIGTKKFWVKYSYGCSLQWYKKFFKLILQVSLSWTKIKLEGTKGTIPM